MNKVRTRIAPSPTGEDIHIGNLYTALINFAVARKSEGNFIIRIEDTDRTRFQEGSEERILASLKNYGLFYDEGPDTGGPHSPYRQSERLEKYKHYSEELVQKGAAYYCICTKDRLDKLRADLQAQKKVPKYDKYCLNNQENVLQEISKGASYVVRLNVPENENIKFTDVVRGEIIFNSSDMDDQVLLKSDGYPTYHLGVVVDDHLMEITHVIRAEEWISSTPKHVLLYKSFGWGLPLFAHLPILRNPDKSKLSKRKNPVWASWYLEEGFLPEAVLNYLALMGWSHPDGKEIFSLEEFIDVFSLKDVNAVGPVFDVTKLTWMNQQYIMALSDEELVVRLEKFLGKDLKIDNDQLGKVTPLIKTRMKTLKDFSSLTAHLLSDYKLDPRNEIDRKTAQDLSRELSKVADWNKDEIFKACKIVMEKEKVRMKVLYYIFTGSESGLPLPESLEILGKEKTLKRLEV